MKKWQIIVVIAISLLVVGLTGCSALAGDSKEGQHVYEVKKDDLIISISGSGNIRPSEEVWLTFSGSGRINKLYVDKSDQVIKDEILAELDTSALGLAKAKAEVELTQAKMTLSEAQLALAKVELDKQTAELNLRNVLDKKDNLELTLLKAQTDLRIAEHHLDETRDIYTWPEIEVADKEVEQLEEYVEYIIEKGLDDRTLAYAQARLDAAKAKFDAMTKSYDTEEVAIAKMQMEIAKMAAAQAQNNLDKITTEIAVQHLQVKIAKISLEQARQSVELAHQSVEVAKKSLTEVQRQLDEATLYAPFAGVIADVTVKEGDMVPSPNLTPMPVIQLLNYDQMELVIEVDEIDIPYVDLGQEAIITIDALPSVKFVGKVDTIYPMPKEIAGVVLYEVKVKLDLPDDSGISNGMSAIAHFNFATQNNVLLVPNHTINMDGAGDPVIKVMRDGQLEVRPVIIGMSNGFDTQIVKGLNEGELVVHQPQ